MSSDYKRVQEALAEGAEPAVLCATCPWDRYCITPPSMTREEIEAQQAEAERKDEEQRKQAEAEGKSAGLPVGTLLTAITYSGKDMEGKMCPVFVARLRSSSGRDVVDLLKSRMQSWDDEAVAQ